MPRLGLKDDYAKEVSKRLGGDLSSLDKSKRELLTDLDGINQSIDSYITDAAKRLLSEKFLKVHYKNYSNYIASGGTREQFIEQEMSTDEKLDAISYYIGNEKLRTGHNDFSSDLKKKQTAKERKKEIYEEQARKLLEKYEKLVTETEEEIDGLEKEIDRLQAQIDKAYETIAEIQIKPDEEVRKGGSTSAKFNKKEAIDEENRKIEAWEKEIKKLKLSITEIKRIQAYYRGEIEQRQKELKIALGEKGMLMDSDSASKEKPNAEEKEKPEEENGNSEETGSTEKSTLPVSLSRKQKAKNMFLDLKSRSPEEQKKLLREYGYADCLSMARTLGPIDRLEFQRIMEERLDELNKNGITCKEHRLTPLTISRNKLRNVKKLNANELRAIKRELDEFMAHYEEKTQEEKDQFQAKLDYLYPAFLLRETGLFRNITRFMDRLTPKGNRIYGIQNSIKFLSDKRHDYETHRKGLLGEWRKTIKVEGIQPRGKKLSLGREHVDEIDRHPEL